MEIFNEMEEKYIETNGIKLHTVIIGSGEPIMLLHGFPDFWYGWRDIILGLKDKYKLIVPDMRGYNLSDKPEGIENYTLKILIEDIKGLSEALKLGKFNLGGHDWGGPIAWGFAEKYPELLKKLIIINGPHPKVFSKLITKDKTQRKASGYIFKFIQPDSEKALIENEFQFLKLVVFGMPIKKNALSEFDKKKYIEAWSQSGAINAGLNYYRASVEDSFGDEEWTGIINVPTLVIHGMKDIALTPKILEGLSDYVKDLKIIRSENASHWVMVDDPELINSSIKVFLG